MKKVGFLLFLKRIDDLVKQIDIRRAGVAIGCNKNAFNVRISLFHLMEYFGASLIKVSHTAVEEYPDPHMDRDDNSLFDVFFFDEIAISVADE